MFLLRRAAFRAISASATPAPIARNAVPLYQSLTPSISTQATSFRRGYATEGEKPEQKTEDTAKEVKDQAQDTVESVVESVKDTASSVADRARSAVSQGFDAVTSELGGGSSQSDRRPERSDRSDRRPARGDRGDRSSGTRYSDRQAPPRHGTRTANGHPDAKPSASLYVGNLYFEVSEDTLRKEFAQFGAIKSLKILFDARGLSKGFGYIEYNDQADATKALESLNNTVLEGRRLTVQYSASTPRPRREFPISDEARNPPSKTLFIGNMSYEMTDKDLNDLFRDIKNVLDVRVAIDRKTGNPRGFAHADFIDTPSAEAAREYLKGKVFYGRNLRVDYSTSNTGAVAREAGAKEESV